MRGLEGKIQNRTAGQSVWTGQDWRATDGTGLQDFRSGQDRTGRQDTRLNYRISCLDRKGTHNFPSGRDRTGGKKKNMNAGQS